MDFWGHFRTKWFFRNIELQMLISPNEDRNIELQMLISQNEDSYQNFGRPLFETHPLVDISKLSLAEAPKTVIGGIKTEIFSEKTVVMEPQ